MIDTLRIWKLSWELRISTDLINEDMNPIMYFVDLADDISMICQLRPIEDASDLHKALIEASSLAVCTPNIRYVYLIIDVSLTYQPRFELVDSDPLALHALLLTEVPRLDSTVNHWYSTYRRMDDGVLVFDPPIKPPADLTEGTREALQDLAGIIQETLHSEEAGTPFPLDLVDAIRLLRKEGHLIEHRSGVL